MQDRNWRIGFLIIASLIVMGSRATYAYNQHHVGQENFLKASLVAGEIEENGEAVDEENGFELREGITKKRVCFKNTGERAVFVRVAFGETFLARGDEMLPLEDTYVTLNWTDEWSEEWQLAEDGWYYYKQILKSKEATAEVLSSVEIAPFKDMPVAYQHATYQLAFTMEVVQYSEEVAVNDDALKKAFNRTATVINDVVTWN